MIGLGFLIAIGPALTILLALTITYGFVRQRSRMRAADSDRRSRHGPHLRGGRPRGRSNTLAS